MKKIGKILALVLTAIIAVVNTGCASSGTSADEGTAADGELKTIRIGSPTADATQLVENAGLALKLGYIDEELEKAGYKAEYAGFGQGGTAINEALSSNQLDIAFVGDIPSMIAKSNGIDIQVVAALSVDSELGIVVGNNSGIESVSDLKGKKIVAAFGTVTYIYLINLLEANGLTIDDVEVINDIANGATLVASGDADAVVSSGLGLYSFRNNGIGTILTTSKEDPSLSTQYLVYGNTSYISSNSAAIEAIIKALIRSKEYAVNNPDGVYETLSTENASAELYAEIYPKELGFEKFEPYLTQVSKDKYNNAANILFESQVIASEVTADTLFTTEYLDKVYKELGLDIPS